MILTVAKLYSKNASKQSSLAENRRIKGRNPINLRDMFLIVINIVAYFILLSVVAAREY